MADVPPAAGEAGVQVYYSATVLSRANRGADTHIAGGLSNDPHSYVQIDRTTTFKELQTKVLWELGLSFEGQFFTISLRYKDLYYQQYHHADRMPWEYEIVWDTIVEEEMNSLFNRQVSA